ncbi:MAG: hypothetical protein JW910_04740, partial [Anaerolineae bacterium]|nr:hypothetical protein [Anaerolineae bacterium]
RVRVGPFVGPEPGRDFVLPGEVVHLSLLWRALHVPASDYNVGVFVIAPDGRVVAEQHGPPQMSFMPMNEWLPGETVRDNHALQLPPDLTPGTYALWVKVYDWRQPESPLTVAGRGAVSDGQAAQVATFTVGER